MPSDGAVTTDLEDIPAFLRLTPEERKAAWVGRKLSTPSKASTKRDYTLPRTIDAAGLALHRHIEMEQAGRTKARLDQIKALKKPGGNQ